MNGRIWIEMKKREEGRKRYGVDKLAARSTCILFRAMLAPGTGSQSKESIVITLYILRNLSLYDSSLDYDSHLILGYI